MHKKMVVGFSIILTVIAVLFTELVNNIMTFLLAGVVPGTHIIAPYWFMMAVYCALISFIATPYLEHFIKWQYDKRHPINKPSTPARRRSIAQ